MFHFNSIFTIAKRPDGFRFQLMTKSITIMRLVLCACQNQQIFGKKEKEKSLMTYYERSGIDA